ncbi:MAG: pyridoxal-5'-phosphate-dependent protein subunit beta [Candidatus Thermofonsia Clade 3 bacterium]|jgi:cysteine synthase|uniref:Pyridoxal-5'-phosphate-dependent protein subunit beta n=1 Tax=Candidatus Thermofonsia Clade 3 bacterium TaxID=2364212 RepID=A0A2M8QDL8_9CHLR|nr:pyridoxal-phosphate dependent enzyme [Candidatus Roseilinea sp. NK_OTU-006]PJF47899.1 MAG: pyridoxal-5'-phosphate-dependent protein subunit beta [Candidatus Thermofonsia Clade 3 bacterium]
MTVLFPTFEEMLHPQRVDPTIRQRAERARTEAPLDSINLFNIHWRKPDAGAHNGVPPVNYLVMPRALTGVDAEIVVLIAKDFPTGSHKVGPAYSVLIEKYISGEIEPNRHTLVFPSTGNFGIGGAWVGPRAGFKSMVILPEGMSRERFEKIEGYGASYIKTHGSESNVKEIYDECKRLMREHPDTVRILNQFSEMGNYRFHYYVTGNTIVELAAELNARLGARGIAAFCSAMGSAGTIAAGDRLKQVFPSCRVVGLEPVQCPTLYNNGYGSHEIQGIGDKHVTWIHHVTNMDALACIDDIECLRVLQVFTHPVGCEALVQRFGIDATTAHHVSTVFGISGVCNLIGAIKAAKHFGLGKHDVLVTVATDGPDRYRSVMEAWNARFPLSPAAAEACIAEVLHRQKTDWIKDGTPDHRRQWHNLKYYTWVEQQGKTVEELNAQLDPEWWLAEQAKVADLDRKIVALRG